MLLARNSSGLLCYPGKLKRDRHSAAASGLDGFRMALLSGEFETTIYQEALERLYHREVSAAFRFSTLEAIEHLPWKPISPTRPYPATSPPWGC